VQGVSRLLAVHGLRQHIFDDLRIRRSNAKILNMKKFLTIAATILASCVLTAGNARAQQTPDNSQAPAQQAPASQTPPSSDAKKPAAKSSDSKAPATKNPASKSQTSGATKTPASKSQTSTAGKPPVHHTAAAPLVLKTDKDKVSYAIGMNIGKNMSKNAVDIDPSILVRGMKDELAGKAQLTDDEVKTVMTAFQGEMKKKQEEKMQEAAATNKKDGDAFLAANKAKNGVVTLPSGLQYKIITDGKGPKPTAQDTVECNYKGTLLDGTEFDSTAKHGGKPATFPVTGVIKGWTEALQLMPVGSKWQLFIPSDLAYGARGAGGVIGPNATLVFEVELVSIQAKPAAAAPAK
jgi:FKBP-type peptidyl-prolyl cis-trans isomerase FklB